MITITKAGSLVKIEHENGVSYVSQSDSPYFRLTDGNLTFRVGAVRIDEKDLSEFTIEGVVPTDEATLTTQLEAVFPNPAGSGSSTPSTIILAAPDDSQWILGVNDSGALTTTELATPVAGAALTSITLTSADGTEWEVTVTNAGALTTTEVV
jgi:hypothetical protein